MEVKPTKCQAKLLQWGERDDISVMIYPWLSVFSTIYFKGLYF